MLTVAFFGALGRQWRMRLGRSLAGKSISAKKLRLIHYPLVAFFSQYSISNPSQIQFPRHQQAISHDERAQLRVLHWNRTLIYAKIEQPSYTGSLKISLRLQLLEKRGDSNIEEKLQQNTSCRGRLINSVFTCGAAYSTPLDASRTRKYSLRDGGKMLTT